MTIIWLGALLIICGVVFSAIQSLLRGRLSGLRRLRATRPGGTLEPERSAGGFSLQANWPGLVMIALGAILLLIGAAF